MRDIMRFLIAIPASLMWLAIICVFVVGTGRIATSVFGEGASERWPAVTFMLVGLGFLILASNLFFAHYFGFAFGID